MHDPELNAGVGLGTSIAAGTGEVDGLAGQLGASGVVLVAAPEHPERPEQADLRGGVACAARLRQSASAAS